MDKADIDPHEPRRFAEDLRKFNDGLQSAVSILSGRITTLAPASRDQEEQKFAEEFEQTLKVLQRLMKSSEEHIPFLLRKADRIDDVLKTLTYREREILKLRYGVGDGLTYTLEEIGRIFQVTRERIRQIESKALRKLQPLVRR